jgi:hypothetical protein
MVISFLSRSRVYAAVAPPSHHLSMQSVAVTYSSTGIQRCFFASVELQVVIFSQTLFFPVA